MAKKFRSIREEMAPERQYLSSLRRFVEAMGGELEIIASFPDGKVRIQLFEDLKEDPEPTTV